MLLAGCGGRMESPTALPQRSVQIDWYGHQCFRIKSSMGITVLTNPFAPGSTGHPSPSGLKPEILLVTNEERTANYVDLVDNAPRIFRGSVGIGTYTSAGVRIVGVPTFPVAGVEAVAGMNVVYRWTMDSLRFCFLGLIMNPLSPSDAAKIGPVDILFMPVGSPDGLSNAERAEIITQLRPKVVIPMGQAGAVDAWASSLPHIYRLGGSAARLSPEAMPQVQTALVFRAP
jgi:L-ascorbate metabolism protein UlaG (beta-lactamase superfamily)